MQFGISKRSLYGSNSCGDDAFTYEDDERVLMAVVDGLGHGKRAAESARIAIQKLNDIALLPIEDIMLHLHSALKPTVGAAVTVAILHKSSYKLEVCGVGNVQLQLVTVDKLYRFDGTPGILGVYRNHCRSQFFQYHPGDIIVIYTDGIKSSYSAVNLHYILHPNPARIASNIMHHFHRGTDDALVLVALEPPSLPQTP